LEEEKLAEKKRIEEEKKLEELKKLYEATTQKEDIDLIKESSEEKRTGTKLF
jgi:hypothetical protein